MKAKLLISLLMLTLAMSAGGIYAVKNMFTQTTLSTATAFKSDLSDQILRGPMVVPVHYSPQRDISYSNHSGSNNACDQKLHVTGKNTFSNYEHTLGGIVNAENEFRNNIDVAGQQVHIHTTGAGGKIFEAETVIQTLKYNWLSTKYLRENFNTNMLNEIFSGSTTWGIRYGWLDGAIVKSERDENTQYKLDTTKLFVRVSTRTSLPKWDFAPDETKENQQIWSSYVCTLIKRSNKSLDRDRMIASRALDNAALIRGTTKKEVKQKWHQIWDIEFASGKLDGKLHDFETSFSPQL